MKESNKKEAEVQAICYNCAKGYLSLAKYEYIKTKVIEYNTKMACILEVDITEDPVISLNVKEGASNYIFSFYYNFNGATGNVEFTIRVSFKRSDAIKYTANFTSYSKADASIDFGYYNMDKFDESSDAMCGGNAKLGLGQTELSDRFL